MSQLQTKHKLHFRWASRIIISILLLSISFPIQAKAVRNPPTSAIPPFSVGISDPAVLEKFLDRIVASQMTKYNIPGAVISVVSDGRVFFAKGYGYANIEKQIPVTADQTIFRVASVSKLFTWTAVMQLVEQGKLDLNTDVNTYLDRFKIPNTYKEPITLAHLMTHTSGFEDQAWNGAIYAQDEASLQPLAEYLRTHIPARVHKPGEIVAYSNYGCSLAGYIVEVIAGMPVEQYIHENILNPLDMDHSTFYQPVPAELADELAIGYQVDLLGLSTVKKSIQPGPFEYVNARAGGSLSSTATDMANFMLMHLQNGQFIDQIILQALTAIDMHRQHYAFDPHMPGVTYGFLELLRNNQRILYHTGNLSNFSSMLALIPDQNVGVFLAYNSKPPEQARFDLLAALLDQYYPYTPATTTPIEPGKSDLARFTGTYLSTQRSFSTSEKFLSLGGYLVTANADNTLSVDSFKNAGGQVIRWMQVEPLFFKEVGGQGLLAFQENEHGQITAMLRDARTVVAYEKQPLYMERMFQIVWLVLSIIIFLLTAMAWLIGRIFRKKRPGPSNPQMDRARLLAGIICSVNLVALIIFFVGSIDKGNMYHFSQLLTVALILWLIATTGVIAIIVFTFKAWKNHYWGILARSYFTFLSIIMIAWVFFLVEWRMLAFNF